MQKVLNLWAGPGFGKSTVAAGIFYHAKRNGVSCELVTEYVKEVVWEGRETLFENQLYLFTKQLKKMSDVAGKVDWIITDAPLRMFLCYMPKNYPQSFIDLVHTEAGRFLNYNVVIERSLLNNFDGTGRHQKTPDAAIAKHEEILKFMDDNAILSTAYNLDDIGGDVAEFIYDDYLEFFHP